VWESDNPRRRVPDPGILPGLASVHCPCYSDCTLRLNNNLQVT